MTPSSQVNGVGHDFAKIPVTDPSVKRDATMVDSRAEQQAKENLPSPGHAVDFVPDHEFYELLAHEVSYRNDLSLLQYLYRKDADDSSRHVNVGDGFAISAWMPNFSTPNPPLVYRISEVAGSDPLNKSFGLAAFTLTPVTRQEAPGILMFRGTEAFADVIADADREGPGSISFGQIRNEIIWTLIDFAVKGGPVVVTGHSLGGALAQLATAAAPSVVTECVTFNSPGVSKKVFDAFAAGTAGGDAAGAAAPKVTHYITRGDVVSTTGEAHLPGQTVMFDNQATRDLAVFYTDAARLELASAGIASLHSLIHGDLDPKLIILPAWAAASMVVKMKALAQLGEILKDLHTNLPLKGSIPLGNESPKDPGPKGNTYQSYPPTEQTSIRPIETARGALGSALMQGIDELSSVSLKMITSGIMPTIGQALARIIDALVIAIAEAGGLKGLLGLMLYVNPETGQMEYWMREAEIVEKRTK